MPSRKKLPDESSALLRLVIENPEDDTPRLVYADWLEENGREDRAEFIRLQCQIARLAETEAEQIDLAERESALMGSHRTNWLAEVPAWSRGGAEFRRGFVEVIEASTRAFLRNGRALFRRAPVLSVQLNLVEDGPLAELAAFEPLANVRELGLTYEDISDTTWQAFLESGLLAGLRELTLISGLYQSDPAPTHGLRNSTSLAGLQKLSFSGRFFGDEALEAIAYSDVRPELRELEFHGEAFSGAGYVSMLRSPMSNRLHSLRWDFPEQALEPALDAIVDSQVHSLRSLAITSTQHLGLEHCEGLAGWPGLRSVRRLDLSSCRLNLEHIEALARSAHLQNLEWLALTGNPIGTDGLITLARCEHLENLRYLRMRGCGIEPKTWEHLANPGQLPSLRVLDLGNLPSQTHVRRAATQQHSDRIRVI